MSSSEVPDWAERTSTGELRCRDCEANPNLDPDEILHEVACPNATSWSNARRHIRFDAVGVDLPENPTPLDFIGSLRLLEGERVLDGESIRRGIELLGDWATLTDEERRALVYMAVKGEQIKEEFGPFEA